MRLHVEFEAAELVIIVLRGSLVVSKSYGNKPAAQRLMLPVACVREGESYGATPALTGTAHPCTAHRSPPSTFCTIWR